MKEVVRTEVSCAPDGLSPFTVVQVFPHGAVEIKNADRRFKVNGQKTQSLYGWWRTTTEIHHRAFRPTLKRVSTV